MFYHLKKYFRILSIDVLVYRITRPTPFESIEEYFIEKQKISYSKIQYIIKDDNLVIHKSCLFMSLNLLRLINKRGPAIGDCITNKEFRGKSIYPYVINKIANEVIVTSKFSEVFILVDSENYFSIRGIEKAGFELYSKIVTKRFLFFYFKTSILYFKA